MGNKKWFCPFIDKKTCDQTTTVRTKTDSPKSKLRRRCTRNKTNPNIGFKTSILKDTKKEKKQKNNKTKQTDVNLRF